jgi:HEAT repeat protein
LNSEETPIHRPLLTAARWLVDGKPGASWRGMIFRQLLNGVQDEQLPLSLRARMLTAFVYSNDLSAPKLFKQLITARTPSVRMLAVLGIGAWGDSGLAGDLIAALGDVEESVRTAACLGLVSLHSETALSAVADVLLNGDERLRQAAAESLVYLPRQGAEIIREAAQVDDLLTRRAAVFGLIQIREPWSKQMLEKIAIEDGQWVVRNAAAQALDVVQEGDPRVPRPLLPPHETPWLVSFAGKRNIGLSEYQSATNVLLLALKSGTFEDQMAALRYLQDTPEENVISAVYSLYYGDQPELKDAALLLIWQWALAGVNLPTPSLYGISLA